MVYEFTPTDSNSYAYGHRLISSDDAKYVLNAHGDVVALIDATNNVIKRYDYDAFGNDLNIDTADTNPFRYCAEYFDTETGTIYLRARYYNVSNGRFTFRDFHWNVDNMIYGDEVKTKEYKDYLGLNDYTVKLVDYAAIRQSGNLYGYCINNPLSYRDYSGESLSTVLAIIVFAAMGFIATGLPAGGTPGNNQAQNKQVDALVNEYNLSKEGRRLLHETISGQDYSYKELRKEAEAIAERGGKYVR